MSGPLIPEDAPFTAEQRAWLNGFFAGWMGLESAREQAPAAAKALLKSPQMNGAPSGPVYKQAPAAAPVAAAVGAESVGSAGGVATLEPEDLEGPWHDESLSIDERMDLAKDESPAHKLMAAMAQLDCGACGYMCDTYALAIATGQEKDLSLCSPGGRETARMLKKISKEDMAAAAAATAAPTAGDEPAAEAQAPPMADGPAPVSRTNPVRARVAKIENLNGEGSSKHTVHVEIDLPDDRLTYRVGDSLGVYPTNSPDLIDQILLCLRAHGTEHVVAPHGIEAKLVEALASTANLKDLSDEMIELVAKSCKDDAEREAVTAAMDDDDLLDKLDVLELLKMAPSATVDVKAFAQALKKLQPRLYSIASSPKAHPGQVHLLIAKVTYTIEERLRLGVASTMFADRLEPGDTSLIYVHGAPGFTVPEDDAAPMIMVGPGTGVAPFRAFLEERGATGAGGDNWLFFGDQHQATDYLYGDEFAAMQASGLLTKLSLAFSRDQEEKVYVQHRMVEAGAELFEWLERGAYFFVCGDASRMAGDVDKALHALIAEHGKRDEAAAKAYVKDLKESKRYVRDVY
ncbi:MAG: sulfite reductase subunit alpha [Planctomycetota bacterium]